MNDEAIRIVGGGLKCDAAGCDYIDETVPFADYERWVNAPCPKCGASLLTPADYAATKMIQGVADWINAMTPPDAERSAARELVRFRFDGSGEVEMAVELQLTPSPSERTPG